MKCQNCQIFIHYSICPSKLQFKKKWIIACKRTDLDDLMDVKDVDYFYKSYVVCSDHFELKCFRNKDMLSQGLIPGSMPTLKLYNVENKNNRYKLNRVASGASINMVTLTVADFGKFKGEAVKKYTWSTASGFSLSVITYGAIVQSIKVPDKNGVTNDVVLGFDDLKSYIEKNDPYLGAAVGRCANRIDGAEFEIDGVKYKVTKNSGEDHLHGGKVGFDKVNWTPTIDGTKVILSYFSKDGEEGYPGDLVTNITYEVTDDDTLHVKFFALTSKKTVVNLTNHSYFNLAGHDTGAEELLKHTFVINADKITETNARSIPTGHIAKVGGTPYDFRTATKLGDVIGKADDLFEKNYCVSNHGNKDVVFVSRVVHPLSGRTLELYSDQPGVQFYTSSYLPAPSSKALIGKEGSGYRKHGAFCLETQKFPDSVHHANFPSAVLTPGEVYTHRVLYTFGVEK